MKTERPKKSNIIMKIQPIKLSLATEVSLAGFSFATVALAALMYLEHGKFNYAMEHLDNVARRAASVTEQSEMLRLKLTMDSNYNNQSIDNAMSQLSNLTERVNLLETRPSLFLTNPEYTIRITPASPPPINADQTIKAESAPMPLLNLGNK